MWRGREAFSKKLHLGNFLKDEAGVEQKGKGRPCGPLFPKAHFVEHLLHGVLVNVMGKEEDQLV